MFSIQGVIWDGRKWHGHALCDGCCSGGTEKCEPKVGEGLPQRLVLTPMISMGTFPGMSRNRCSLKLWQWKTRCMYLACTCPCSSTSWCLKLERMNDDPTPAPIHWFLLLRIQTSLVSWNPRGAMPVLNRYDAAEDELRPASAAAWRYDASSDSCEDDPSETPGWTKSLTQVNS